MNGVPNLIQWMVPVHEYCDFLWPLHLEFEFFSGAFCAGAQPPSALSMNCFADRSRVLSVQVESTHVWRYLACLTVAFLRWFRDSFLLNLFTAVLNVDGLFLVLRLFAPSLLFFFPPWLLWKVRNEKLTILPVAFLHTVISSVFFDSSRITAACYREEGKRGEARGEKEARKRGV